VLNVWRRRIHTHSDTNSLRSLSDMQLLLIALFALGVSAANYLDCKCHNDQGQLDKATKQACLLYRQTYDARVWYSDSPHH
jgi:hypothetical protein